MEETERILDQLARAYDGDAWFGFSVRAALDGVDARAANARPIPSAHTICEIVLHVTSWTREVTRRLGSCVAQDPEGGDWPVREVGTDGEWNTVLAGLDTAQAELADAVKAVDEESLAERIGEARNRALGSGVSMYVTLHGLAQHHAYHAGQIALLRRGVQAD